MPEVRVGEGVLWCGAERVALVMGEVHYWRLAPARWRRVLESCRRLGLKMVATYVPWQYHELEPGRFDFEGATEPQRDLDGFLGLVAEMGLRCFIRPGPYIYSEWTNAGVPDRVAMLSRISEAYRREAGVWMEAATRALRPFFATSEERFGVRGGPIVLFQPDNEMDLFSHWFEGELGLDGASRGRGVGAGSSGASGRVFQDFLLRMYPDLAALNEAWGTAYRGFDEAQPTATVINRFDRGAHTRALDYWRFQHWATATALEWHARRYRELGLDVPMVANYYPGGDVQDWRLLGASGVDFLGIDWYPRNEFVGPPAPPGASGATGGGGIFGLAPAREHRVFLDSCRLQKAVSKIPFIAELECGVWHGYEGYTGAFSPNHYRLLLCSALLAGIKGFNWYMFVGRDNWYFTPINERGDLRPELAAEFMELHRVWREIDPPSLEKRAAAAAFFETEQIGTDDLLGSNPVLQALYDAGVDYEMVDAAAVLDRRGGPGPKLMFYAAADWLLGGAQAALLEWVEAGGTLVLGPRWPRADEGFRACNGLGILPPDRALSHLGKKVELSFGGAVVGTAEGGICVWDRVPEGAEPVVATQMAGKQQVIENADVWMRGYIGTTWTAGYVEKRGAGRIVLIGVPLSASVVLGAHGVFGDGVAARAEVAGVQVGLFERGLERYLVAANLGATGQTRVAISGLTRRVRVVDLFSGEGREMEAGNLVVSIGRASGGVWRVEGVE